LNGIPDGNSYQIKKLQKRSVFKALSGGEDGIVNNIRLNAACFSGLSHFLLLAVLNE